MTLSLPLGTVTGPLATVLVLNALQPLRDRLLAAMEVLTPESADWLDREVQVNGSAVLFRGAPVEAQEVSQSLRAHGLTTSVNLLAPERAATSVSWNRPLVV